MTGIEFLLGIAGSIAASAIYDRVGNLKLFDKAKVDAKVNELVISVIEPLSTFLSNEKISDADIDRLSELAKEQVQWMLGNPGFAAERGLDSDRITQDLIQRIQDDNRSDCYADHPGIFEIILRALVDLAVTLPPRFEDWQQHSFTVTYTMLDEIKTQLNEIYQKLAEKDPTNNRDSKFENILTSSRRRTALTLSMDGLSTHSTEKKKIDQLFVFPAFEYYPTGELDPRSINDEATFFATLAKHTQQVIEAPAGAGKTTWAKWLQAALINPPHSIFPLYLPLRKVMARDRLPCLYEAMQEQVSTVFQSSFSRADVEQWAKAGKILVIFDGFDEVAEAKRDSALDWIKDLHIAFPGIICQVTSRPLTTNHLTRLANDAWQHLTLQPFDKRRIVDYIQRFQEHGPEIQTDADPKSAKELAEQWQEDPTIGPLTSNPLLLSTLLMVHHMDRQLPDDRAELYDRYIDGMLGRWENQKNLSAPKVHLTKDQKLRILQLLAINMIETEQDAIEEEDAKNWLTPYLEDSNIDAPVAKVLAHLRERSGLLIGPGQYSFAHKSIGEFLVAQAIESGTLKSHNGQRYDRALLYERCLQDRWTTPVFLWAGYASLPEVKDFIDWLLNHPDGQKKPFLQLCLAGGLLSDRKKKLDRKWLEEANWHFIKLGNASDSLFYTDGAIKLPLHPFRIHNPSTFIPMHQLKQIGQSDYDYLYLLILFHNSMIDANDWPQHIEHFSPMLWSAISYKLGYNQALYEAAPKDLTKLERLLIMTRASHHREPDQKSNIPDTIAADFANCKMANLFLFVQNMRPTFQQNDLDYLLKQEPDLVSHFADCLSYDCSTFNDTMMDIIGTAHNQEKPFIIKSYGYIRDLHDECKTQPEAAGFLPYMTKLMDLFEAYEKRTGKNLQSEHDAWRKEEEKLRSSAID